MSNIEVGLVTLGVIAVGLGMVLLASTWPPVRHESVLSRFSCPVLPEDFGDVPRAKELAAQLNAEVCPKTPRSH